MSKILVAQMTLPVLDYLYEKFDFDKDQEIKLFQSEVKSDHEKICSSFDAKISQLLHQSLNQLENGIHPDEEFSYLEVIIKLLKINFLIEVRFCKNSKEFFLGFSYHQIELRPEDLVDTNFELLLIHETLKAEFLEFVSCK
ncbi:MAG: hypothetical protein V7776_21800 [Halopseudomonas aestusnigri]